MGYTRIQVRNDPSHLWTLANPVLASGELGAETDTRKLKLGDGTTPWNDLPYLRGTGADGTGEVDWGQVVGNIASNAALLQALDGKQNTSEKGKADGYAALGADKKLLETNIPALLERTSNKGAPGGYAPLGPDGAVPAANLPADMESTANKGAMGGYAGLGNDGKLLEVNLPTSLERHANRGIAGGYAPLGADNKVPVEYLPPLGPSGGGDGVPRGVILMWSGGISDIPLGWALCDGTQGTPNLLDKFIVCVPNKDTNPGATGGTHAQRLTVNQLPAHKHAAEVTGHTHELASHTHAMDHTHNVSVGSHTHTMYHSHSIAHSHLASGTVGSAGNHSHSLVSSNYVVPLLRGTVSQANITTSSSPIMVPSTTQGLGSATSTGASGDHSHSLSGLSVGSPSPSSSGDASNGSTGPASAGSGPTGASSRAATGEASGATGEGKGNVSILETGNSAVFDNRPAYYALALIMKL